MIPLETQRKRKRPRTAGGGKELLLTVMPSNQGAVPLSVGAPRRGGHCIGSGVSLENHVRGGVAEGYIREKRNTTMDRGTIDKTEKERNQRFRRWVP